MAIKQGTADTISIMCSMTSPSGKTISKNELVKNFDSPDTDAAENDVAGCKLFSIIR